ncbi:GNAT family N-acetyltransferase [Neptunicella sp. SCSIO 80796]|uniref:GNAT family N-acetyltransferase n=1 Tax=Neptunicella plasticusilytica TaxID=3117012 RepID=UPI003A4E4E80
MIRLVTEQADKIRCFAVLSGLRPHLSLDDFLLQVSRMEIETGYQLACLEDAEAIKAVAGFRISEWLHTGKYLEIEELITADGNRSKGYGGQLYDWLLDFAKQQKCAQMRLVSGVSREAAHKFYLNKGMKFEAKYFSINTE